MRKAENIDSIAAPTAEPDVAPMPPILPVKREWRAAVLEAGHGPWTHTSAVRRYSKSAYWRRGTFTKDPVDVM